MTEHLFNFKEKQIKKANINRASSRFFGLANKISL